MKINIKIHLQSERRLKYYYKIAFLLNKRYIRKNYKRREMKSLRSLFRIGLGPSSSHTMGPNRAAKEFGCPVFAEYTELFGMKDQIDLVVNSTFSYMHAPITIDLADHGFNVVCEKPFAKTYEQGCRVIAAAKKSGKMVNAFQQSRLAPYYRKIREILASGILGELMQISISFSGFSRRWDWQTSQAFAATRRRRSPPGTLAAGNVCIMCNREFLAYFRRQGKC